MNVTVLDVLVRQHPTRPDDISVDFTRAWATMDNPDLLGHPALEGRILFVSVPPDNAAAAWMKRNDPIKDFDQIQNLVKAGFMVRTRADEPTEQARSNDIRMRDHALTSGAQYISTDYPEPNSSFSPYCVRFEGAHVAQSNPVNGAAKVNEKDLE